MRRELNDKFENFKSTPFLKRVDKLKKIAEEVGPTTLSWEMVEEDYGLKFSEDERTRIRRLLPDWIEAGYYGLTITQPVHSSNPGNPDAEAFLGDVGSCLRVRLTEEEDIEFSFKESARCKPIKEKYRKILQTAVMGGETIYKTLRGEAPKPRMPEY